MAEESPEVPSPPEVDAGRPPAVSPVSPGEDGPRDVSRRRPWFLATTAVVATGAGAGLLGASWRRANGYREIMPQEEFNDYRQTVLLPMGIAGIGLAVVGLTSGAFAIRAGVNDRGTTTVTTSFRL